MHRRDVAVDGSNQRMLIAEQAYPQAQAAVVRFESALELFHRAVGVPDRVVRVGKGVLVPHAVLRLDSRLNALVQIHGICWNERGGEGGGG